MFARLGSVLAWFEVQSHRAALYRAASVLGPLFIVAGFVSSGQEGAALTILGALAGFGGNRLADRHSRPRKAHSARGAVSLLELGVLIIAGVLLATWLGWHPGH